MSFDPVPPCKGCGSTNLVARARAEVSSEYTDPIGVKDGQMLFKHSYSGYGENERWRFECEDCGRGMRLDLAPVEAPA